MCINIYIYRLIDRYNVCLQAHSCINVTVDPTSSPQDAGCPIASLFLNPTLSWLIPLPPNGWSALTKPFSGPQEDVTRGGAKPDLFLRRNAGWFPASGSWNLSRPSRKKGVTSTKPTNRFGPGLYPGWSTENGGLQQQKKGELTN